MIQRRCIIVGQTQAFMAGVKTTREMQQHLYSGMWIQISVPKTELAEVPLPMPAQAVLMDAIWDANRCYLGCTQTYRTQAATTVFVDKQSKLHY